MFLEQGPDFLVFYGSDSHIPEKNWRTPANLIYPRAHIRTDPFVTIDRRPPAVQLLLQSQVIGIQTMVASSSDQDHYSQGERNTRCDNADI